ncbi:MAG: hypothetical protein HY068_14780 [Burkholderiales bacterium]|nr:hypothetical protein [Burkholderiales bacterium]
MKRFLSFWALATLAGTLAAQPVSFGLFGDMPYSRWEREQLPALLNEMKREPLAFVVHDGDFKSGGTVCSDEVFLDMLGVFQSSYHPLVFVPGDNEWTDCHRKNNGSYDPLERLAKLREVCTAAAARCRSSLSAVPPIGPGWRRRSSWRASANWPA